MNKTHSPVALVIDDDGAIIQRMRNGFLQDTSMGVLVADNLRTAVDFLTDMSVQIDALVVDLHFAPPTQHESLQDGIDLLELSKKHRPNLPSYMLSVDAGDETVRDRCADRHLRVSDFFPKLGPYRDAIPPWLAVEKACLSQSFKKDGGLRKVMEREGIELRDLVEENDIAAKVRQLYLPRLTYLLDVPGYHVKKPIEVVCVSEKDGSSTASAIQIGLMTDGEGNNAIEALDDLATLIAAEANLFSAELEEPLGYGAYVKKRLDHFLEGPIKPTS